MLDLPHGGELSDELIIDRAQKAHKPVLLALFFYRTDDLIALLPFRDKLRDHLGRVLKVGAERYDAVARRLQHPVEGRVELPEIARVEDRFDALVPRAQLFKPPARLILRIVVDKHDLIIVRRELPHLRDERLAHRDDVLLFVKTRNQKADFLHFIPPLLSASPVSRPRTTFRAPSPYPPSVRRCPPPEP